MHFTTIKGNLATRKCSNLSIYMYFNSVRLVNIKATIVLKVFGADNDNGAAMYRN